jgi:GNAT superfamily N-acetyltransferase
MLSRESAHPLTASSSLSIRALTDKQDDEVAQLLHRSLTRWYETHLNQGARFGDSHLPFLHFPALYRRIDPEHSLGAWLDQQLAGVAFIHPRETHVAAGIIATNPAFARRGIAKALVTKACNLADQLNLPLRLVSSLLNLDSFSLYSRCGFRPVTIYQDVLLAVPPTGITVPELQGVRIAPANPEHAPEIAQRERELCGISRLSDHQALLAQTALPWEVLVARDSSNTLLGAVTFTRHPEWSMPGPAFAQDETVLSTLLLHALNHLKGRDIVTLIPSDARKLLASMYALGGRNIELHALQVRGEWKPPTGLSIPTFLPETF